MEAAERVQLTAQINVYVVFFKVELSMFGVTFISPSLAPRSSLAVVEGVRLPSSGSLQNLPISVCLSHGTNVPCLRTDS